MINHPNRKRIYLCAYGNCQQTECTISTNNTRAIEKKHFCSEFHAGLYMLGMAWGYSFRQDWEQKLLGEADRIQLERSR